MGKSAAMFCCLIGLIGVGQGLAAQPAQVNQFDLARDIGLWAASSQGSSCLSIANGELKPGQEIVLVWVPVAGEPHQPAIRRGRIAAKLAAHCDAANQSGGDSSYRLDAGRLDDGRVYIAIAARPSSSRVVGSEVKMLVGKHDLTFRSCTSTEGLHFSAWSGTRPKERLVWRRYFYLGYDVEPTCVERDFTEVKP